MRIANDALFSSVAMTADRQSDAVFIGHIFGLAIQAVWTGTPAGNITVQGSCDSGKSDIDPTGVTNWDTISTQAAGGAAGTKLFNLDGQYYRWVRLVYTFTASTGALSARINIKGF